MTIVSPEAARIGLQQEALVNGAGEVYRAKEVSDWYRDVLRRMVGDTARALQVDEAWGKRLIEHVYAGLPSELDDDGNKVPANENEGITAACADASYVVASCAADIASLEDPVWMGLWEASRVFAAEAGFTDGIDDDLDYAALDSTPDEADIPGQSSDTRLLAGLPNACAQDTARRVEGFVEAACRLAYEVAGLHEELYEAEPGDDLRSAAATKEAMRRVVGLFGRMEQVAATGSRWGGPYALSAHESLRALADALDARSEGDSLTRGVVAVLCGAAPDGDADVIYDRQAAPALEGLHAFCNELSETWKAGGALDARGRYARAAGEHFGQAATLLNAYRGRTLSIYDLAPEPPDPFMDALAESIVDIRDPQARAAAKDLWQTGCVLAVSVIKGYATRARDEAEREALQGAARSMARRAIGVDQHELRTADFVFCNLF